MTSVFYQYLIMKNFADYKIKFTNYLVDSHVHIGFDLETLSPVHNTLFLTVEHICQVILKSTHACQSYCADTNYGHDA